MSRWSGSSRSSDDVVACGIVTGPTALRPFTRPRPREGSGRLSDGDVVVDDDTRGALQELMDLASGCTLEEGDSGAGAQWFREHMPRLLYLDTFPEIDGRQDLAQFILKLRDGKLEAKEHYFRMLLSMSGIIGYSLIIRI